MATYHTETLEQPRQQTNLLLTVRTTLHTYVVQRDHVHDLRLISEQHELAATDERGKPLVGVELGKFLDPEDLPSNTRRHALVVPLRRRSVALLVERVEDAYTTLATTDVILPLPILVKRALARSWYQGVVIRNELPLLVLDVRAIARDSMIAQGKRP
jgi:hypothetical protein